MVSCGLAYAVARAGARPRRRQEQTQGLGLLWRNRRSVLVSSLCLANVSANVPPLTGLFLPCRSPFPTCDSLPALLAVVGPRCPRNRQVGGSNPPSGSRSAALFRSSIAALRLTFVPIRGWLEVQRIGGLACWLAGTPWGAALPGAYCCHSSAVGEPNSEQILTNGSLSRAGPTVAPYCQGRRWPAVCRWG
jgi:hypothetical protein